jgi:hypothetical protein
MVRRERLSDALRSEDLLIAPPLPENINVMDWHRHEEISARAYDYTAKLMAYARAAILCLPGVRVRGFPTRIKPVHLTDSHL